MKIKLFLNGDVNSNANFYFEKAKKLKAKIPGVLETIKKTKQEIKDFEEKKSQYVAKREQLKKIEIHKKKEWYDKFRSTITTEGFLFVIGKDAGTNEVLIKKHLEENDLVMHTEEPGSPFGVIKGGKDKISKQEIDECAQFLSCFSSQWKRGFGNADLFWVFPDQVSKKANTGEYMSKGSFMIRGEKHILKNIPLKICLGVKKEVVKTDEGDVEIDEFFSGSQKACEKFCGSRFIKLEPGSNNYKALTREIRKRLKFSPEDLPKYIPNDCKILKK